MDGGLSAESVARRALPLAPAGEAAPPIKARRLRTISARKRLFDLVIAGGLLIVLLPVLAAIWLTIRATSPGPGLFWSDRVGYRGTIFAMPKFRTMRIDAPLVAREKMTLPDRYVTPIGKLLRRFSLDELPQLICVVRGDMSLIGPRPLIQTDPAQRERSRFPEVALVRPGLSGLAQVRGRNFVAPRRKARLDAFYARTRSWALDLKIIASTVGVLLSGKGVL